MKQGTAKTIVSGTKVEPISHGVNVAAVAELGVHEVRTTSLPLYEGRGLKAPMVGETTHKSGSQGKY